MTDLLLTIYPWVKAMHVMSVITWMAGLFYLPRLYVYHTEKVQAGSETDALFQTMEHKLLRVIMAPASVATWVFGTLLAITPGVVDWGAVWPYPKALAVIAMTWFHHWLVHRRSDFAKGANTRTGRQYRMMNEVPTVLMVIIVISIIVRPF